MKKEKNETHPIFQLKNLWDTHSHQVWVGSTLRLIRNLSKFKFPPKLDTSRQHQIVSLIYEGLKTFPDLVSPKLFQSEDLGPLQKEFLIEHFLVQDGFHKAHSGEGFIVDNQGEFLAVINIQDHLQLYLIDTHQEMETLWGKLIKIENHLGKSLDFAFNSRFGFLTADPVHSGTGLIVSLFLHIPASIHTGELSEILERKNEEEIEAVGLQGKTSELIGDILVVNNTCSLGLTEEYILTSMRMWATRAIVSEMNVRKKLLEGENEQIKNKVTRALGLLTHSYQLEVIEALNALSLVKLGTELNWITAPPDLNMNQLLFNCRRAHLMNRLEKKVDVPELSRKRAEYLHEIATKLTLKI